jgi:hypothetical protein
MSETELGKQIVPSYSCILCERTETSPGKPNLDSFNSNQFSCMEGYKTDCQPAENFH